MELVDRDLRSRQEVRLLVGAAKEAQKKLAEFSQQEIDNLCLAMAKAGHEHSVRLAKMANEETGFGRADDKVLKNELATVGLWDFIGNQKTVGIISDCPEKKIFEVAVPMGVIAGIIPSTNPTSTVFFKAIISIKSGNAIVFSPHPGAKNCILEASRIMSEALRSAGGPAEAVACVETPTVEGTSELMRHHDIALILATGGSAMVEAAYSSGNPAIGVGPGNGPAYIERTADIPLAVKRILDSKCFDNGTICASEQSVVTEECIKDEVIAELKKQGAYFLSPDEKEKVGSILMRGKTMNPAIVGKTPQYIGKLAGIEIPAQIRVIVGFEDEVGDKFPFSKEKLCPVLAFYTEQDWESACELCIRILMHEGAGHTMMIHTKNDDVVREFALKKPVSRLLVNTPGALGGVGATTNLSPSFTLGCGAVGGNSTSDNIGPQHLLNIRRVAYGVREFEDIAGKQNELKSSSSEDELVKLVLEKLLSKFN